VDSHHARQQANEAVALHHRYRLRLLEVHEGGSMTEDKYSSVLWLQGRNRRLTDAIREMLEYLYNDNFVAAAAVGEHIILGDEND